MPIYQQYLYVIGSFQGILLASLLLFSFRISIASRILGVWCLFLALSLLANFITINGEINIFTGLIGWPFFLPASYGALLFLYCRYALVDRSLKWQDLLHFIPFVLCYLLNLDFLLASPSEKLHFVISHQQPPLNLQIAQSILFIQAFVYLALSANLIWRRQSQASQTLSSYNPAVFTWLWSLLSLDFVIWTLKLMGVVYGHTFEFFFVGDVLITVLIYSIGLAQWRNPRLFTIELFSKEQDSFNHGKAHQPDSELGETNLKSNLSGEPEGQAQRGALDPEVRSQLLIHVQQYMNQHQSYLDNQLTLTRLADAVGVSGHHLSEVLNQHDGKNFYRFVNEYRINHVCEKLKHDPSLKILDLAMSSGFSSKSTFNAVFKQITKHTPSQYRSQLLVN